MKLPFLRKITASTCIGNLMAERVASEIEICFGKCVSEKL